jgi:UDP-N-acetyl-D-mannosaminuronic acid dehydrogenase
MGDIRAVLDDLLPLVRSGQLIVPALDGRAGHDRVRGRLPGEAARLLGRRGPVRRARARSGSPPTASWTRSDAAVHRRRVGEASGERAARLFEPLGAPIVQTTPVQAELAKIWTNILRYATFALPNLLMMDCERYGANVFDVIELINRDYPRGGIGRPG